MRACWVLRMVTIGVGARISERNPSFQPQSKRCIVLVSGIFFLAQSIVASSVPSNARSVNHTLFSFSILISLSSALIVSCHSFSHVSCNMHVHVQVQVQRKEQHVIPHPRECFMRTPIETYVCHIRIQLTDLLPDASFTWGRATLIRRHLDILICFGYFGISFLQKRKVNLNADISTAHSPFNCLT